MALQVFDVTGDYGQVFTTILNGKRATVRLRHNATTDRFVMDLSVDEAPVLTGRKVVSEIDLLEPFALGLGKLFASDATGQGRPPTPENFAAGIVRLYHLV